MPTVTNFREWVMFILTLFIVPGLGAMASLQFSESKSAAALAQQTHDLSKQIVELKLTVEKLSERYQAVNAAQVACDIRMIQIKAELDELRAARRAK